ncbi:MAG: hypothetical protein UW11_C0046G0002 [Parcubacteria group bacterium GW2011_GWA2_43_9b]|nr:MAG: hypothetical protein UW11_C0046G0002 [Parcubacteria group bacterium GW2011_GWA2_43_9b]
MKCQDCGGEVNAEIKISLMTGCGGWPSKDAYPCKACNRLHWEDGGATSNRGGNPSFLEEGRLVIKDKKTGETLFRF